VKQIRIFLLLALLIFAVTALRQGTKSAAAASAPRRNNRSRPRRVWLISRHPTAPS
jgi:hypothetical protein